MKAKLKIDTLIRQSGNFVNFWPKHRNGTADPETVFKVDLFGDYFRLTAEGFEGRDRIFVKKLDREQLVLVADPSGVELLEPEQKVLRLIKSRPEGYTAPQVAKYLKMSPNAVKNIISLLIIEGQVHSTPDGHRRYRFLDNSEYSSGESASMLKQIKEIAERAPDINMNNFTDDQVSALNEAMNQILQVFTKEKTANVLTDDNV